MTRKERETAVEQLEKLRQKSLEVTWMPTDTSYRDSFALNAAIDSLKLWDSLVERLAERCNVSTSATEYNTYKAAIDVIKKEMGV